MVLYHRSTVNCKPPDVVFSALPERIKTNPKDHWFKIGHRGRITKCKNIFSKVHRENWSREIIVIDSGIKPNSWTYILKDFNEEKVIGTFYGKELLLRKLSMSY